MLASPIAAIQVRAGIPPKRVCTWTPRPPAPGSPPAPGPQISSSPATRWGPASGAAGRRAPARALVLESPSPRPGGRRRVAILGAGELDDVGPLQSDRWIGKVHTPVLIVHGDRDGTIPFAGGARCSPWPTAQDLRAHPRRRPRRSAAARLSTPYVWRFLGLSPASSAPGWIKPA